jgi:large subunit ribosomal protein L10
VVKDFAKGNEKLIAMLISLGGAVLSGKDLDKVASLPTREQALAQLLGVMQAPIEKFVRTLAAPHTKLVRTIEAIRAQKAAAGA